MSIGTVIKTSIAVIGTTLTSLLGGWDMALQILVAMVVLDYISGLSSAFVNNKVSSQIGARGIVKKVSIFIIVVLAAMIDKMLNTDAQVVRVSVIYFYVANEGISILENLAMIGVPFPAILKDKLIQIQGDKKEGGQDVQ